MVVTARVERRSSGRLDGIIKSLKGPTEVHVGFPKGKVESDILNRAVWNEFGTKRIPPRPFMANAMASNRSKYTRNMNDAARSLLAGSSTLNATMKKLGIQAQGDIQREITALRNPANAASTIKRKGSSNPLIESGRMRASVTWRVER